jgi:hypothetical protein
MDLHALSPACAESVRLVHGANQYEGHVEVKVFNGPWGAVCGDTWDALEASVICWWVVAITLHLLILYTSTHNMLLKLLDRHTQPCILGRSPLQAAGPALVRRCTVHRRLQQCPWGV